MTSIQQTHQRGNELWPSRYQEKVLLKSNKGNWNETVCIMLLDKMQDHAPWEQHKAMLQPLGESILTNCHTVLTSHPKASICLWLWRRLLAEDALEAMLKSYRLSNISSVCRTVIFSKKAYKTVSKMFQYMWFLWGKIK